MPGRCEFVKQERVKRQVDASALVSVAGDVEEMILTAWDCLGVSKRGKALSSPEIVKLIDSYKARQIW